MKTLDAPVYEVNQDSEWYRQTVEYKKRQRDFFEEINQKYFEDNGFTYYHSEYFGVRRNSKDYDTYKNELSKNPNKNGIHIFKKRSKYFPIFKEMIKKIGNYDPFKPHDVFGYNNISASQWICDRWFFSVYSQEYVKGEDVTPIEYKDYLKIVMDAIK